MVGELGVRFISVCTYVYVRMNRFGSVSSGKWGMFCFVGAKGVWGGEVDFGFEEVEKMYRWIRYSSLPARLADRDGERDL